MDRDHRLDAPDNESLRTIEQLSDRSELTTIYPHKHNDWDGIEIISRELREEKRNQEQLRINQSIRKTFPIIGLLVPLPFVLASIILAVSATYFTPESRSVLIVPAIIIVFIWLYVSRFVIKKTFAIFYAHSIKATPFILTLLILLGLSMKAHMSLVEPYYTNQVIYNSTLSGVVVLLTSIILSGILIFIWTTQKISAAVKVLFISILCLAILVATLCIDLF